MNQLNLKCGHTSITKGCSHCTTLFRTWNKNLKDTGHTEIENFENPNNPLNDWDNYRFRKMSPEVLESKRMYYESCSKLLLEYAWGNAQHKEVWRLHSEGFTTREIAKFINKKKFDKQNISRIIRHYKKELA